MRIKIMFEGITNAASEKKKEGELFIEGKRKRER